MTVLDLASGSSDDADGRLLTVVREGTVRQTPDPLEPWRVEFPVGSVVPIAAQFVRELVARDATAATCRSYAFDLLRWWRFLAARGRPWTHACRDDVREFVPWLRSSDNPQRRPGRVAVNARTGKPNLTAGYAPATINHALSVISVLYEFAAEQGEGPVVNPVPAARPGSSWVRRLGLDDEFLLPKRAPYRQRQPDHVRRAVDDGLLVELFDALGCDRDRALIAFYLSSGARASELLGVRHVDVDWGAGTIAVVSKGSRAREVIPAAPDAFVWLRRYLGADGGPSTLNAPLWWTRRQPRRPLTYSAVRALLQRVNDRIGTNITLHDLRHTCAFRLASDPAMSLVDVQAVLRHRRLATTQRYIQPDLNEVIGRVRAHHQRTARNVVVEAGAAEGWVYDSDDLAVRFGTS